MTDNTTTTEAEARVEAAAAAVSEWKSNVASVSAKIQDQTALIAERAKTRRESALSAALDQGTAGKKLASARDEQLLGERTKEDLAHALEMANVRLKEAEVIHRGACRAVALEHAREVIARRVAAAARFDAAAREMEAALTEYNGIWSELAGVDFDGNSGMGMSAMEGRRGDYRIPGALPPAMRKLLSIGGPAGSLENSERLVWRGVA
jgi:hypothetical protein